MDFNRPSDYFVAEKTMVTAKAILEDLDFNYWLTQKLYAAFIFSQNDSDSVYTRTLHGVSVYKSFGIDLDVNIIYDVPNNEVDIFVGPSITPDVYVKISSGKSCALTMYCLNRIRHDKRA